MKRYLILLFSTLVVLSIILAGCSTLPNIQKMNEIPADAVEIMTSELLGENGTYTKGSIYVSGNGYLVLDVQLQSGSVKSIGIKEATKDETVYAIKNPETALYDSALYEYKSDCEYKLNFVDAKEIQGSITVYFIAE